MADDKKDQNKIKEMREKEYEQRQRREKDIQKQRKAENISTNSAEGDDGE